MANVTTRSRAQAVHARIQGIKGDINCPVDSRERGIRATHMISDVASAVAAEIEGAAAHDTGRLIAFLDAMETAQNLIRQALWLPHASKVAQ